MKKLLALAVAAVLVYWLFFRTTDLVQVERPTRSPRLTVNTPRPTLAPRLFYHSPLDAPAGQPGKAGSSGYFSTDSKSRFGNGLSLGPAPSLTEASPSP